MRSDLVTTLAAAGLLLVSSSATKSVPLPPDDATAAEVLNVYLQALQAGDCDTAHDLAGDSFVFSNGELCGHLVVTAYSPPDVPMRPSAHEVVFATTLTVKHGDASMPDGDHTWFYSLTRQDDGAWRLSGGGSGP